MIFARHGILYITGHRSSASISYVFPQNLLDVSMTRTMHRIADDPTLDEVEIKACLATGGRRQTRFREDTR